MVCEYVHESQHNITICDPRISLHHGNTESRKNLDKTRYTVIIHRESMNASHSINLLTNSRHHISTNGKAPPHPHKNQQQCTTFFILSDKGLTLETSAFLIFHGSNAPFIISLNTTKFSWNRFWPHVCIMWTEWASQQCHMMSVYFLKISVHLRFCFCFSLTQREIKIHTFMVLFFDYRFYVKFQPMTLCWHNVWCHVLAVCSLLAPAPVLCVQWNFHWPSLESGRNIKCILGPSPR